MLIAPQVILPEPLNPGVDIRLREFAHRLAKTHEVDHSKNISHQRYNFVGISGKLGTGFAQCICNLQSRAVKEFTRFVWKVIARRRMDAG